MISPSSKLAIGLLATSAVIFSAAGAQAQGDIESARTFCLAELQKMYPNQQPDSTNRQALSYYQQCMTKRGFTP
jgi:hypothetical protein